MIIENWKQYIYDNIDTAAEKIMLAAIIPDAINITDYRSTCDELHADFHL